MRPFFWVKAFLQEGNENSISKNQGSIQSEHDALLQAVQIGEIDFGIGGSCSK
jgi:hypothetical protein